MKKNYFTCFVLVLLVNFVSLLQADIVAEYTFENTSSASTAFDTACYFDPAADGTIKGSASKVYDTTRNGYVLDCSGTYYNYASLGTYNPSDGTNELTISTWVKWNGSTGYTMSILSKRTNYTNSEMMWTLGVGSTSNRVYFASVSSTLNSADPITANEWFHVAVTLDSDQNAKIYINGQLVSSMSGFVMNNGVDAELCLGSTQGNWYCLNGFVDDVRIYNDALSEQAVQRLINYDAESPASYIYPANQSVSVDGSSLDLSWVEDGDGSTYDLYFGISSEQIDTAGRVVGDVDGNGVVDNTDFLELANAWLGDAPDGKVVDFNGDGTVNAIDFAMAVSGIDSEDVSRHVYKGNKDGANYTFSELGAGEYFWRVDRINNGKVVLGEVQSFICDGASAAEVFADKHIQRPVILYDTLPVNYQAVTVGNLNFNGSTEDPIWKIAQWYCDYSLENCTIQDLGNGAVKYYDPMKSITFSELGGIKSDVILEIDTRVQYGTTYRSTSEPWPHLLISQNFDGYYPRLTELAALHCHLEAKLLYAERFEYEGYTPLAHAAHCQEYLMVQNLNPNSSGYHEYLWFGIGIYDDRSDITASSGVPYIGGNLATGEVIYAPPRTIYTSENVNDGNWVTIEADVLPHIYAGIEAAWEKGFLVNSDDLNDFAVVHMNIGWEVEGINNVGIQYRNISLKAIYP